MKHSMPSVEQPGPIEQLAHRGALALKIGLGVLAIHEYRQIKKSESFADYAKNRAQKIWHGAKPLANLAFSFVRNRIDGHRAATMTDETTVAPAQSLLQETEEPLAEPIEHSDKGIVEGENNKPEQAVEPQPADIAAQPDEAEQEPKPVFDLTAVFASGDNFVQAFEGKDTPQEIRDALRYLSTAWKAAQSVPQAAALWESYVRPALLEMKGQATYPAEAAQFLKSKAQSLSQYIAVAVAHIQEDEPDSGQIAFSVYQVNIRSNGGYGYNSNDRTIFESAAADYIAAIKQVNTDNAADALYAADNVIQTSVEQFLSNSTSRHISKSEADRLVHSIRAELPKEITTADVTTVTARITDTIRQQEGVQAAQRRNAMGNFLSQVRDSVRIFNGNGMTIQSAGTRELNDIQAALFSLDRDIQSPANMSTQHWEVEQNLVNVANALARLGGRLDQDSLYFEGMRSAVSNLLQLL